MLRKLILIKGAGTIGLLVIMPMIAPTEPIGVMKVRYVKYLTLPVWLHTARNKIRGKKIANCDIF